MPNKIVKLKVHEVSTVDKAANGKSFVVIKSAYTQEQRDEMAKKGEALPDGSYPIKTETDVSDAIKSVGLGKEPEGKIKDHIIKRAKALNCSDKLPADWTVSKSIVKKITDAVLKALDFNAESQEEIPVIKAGKKISGERMNTLKDLHSQLGSFIAGASDEQPNNEPDEEPADPANNAQAGNANADPANNTNPLAKGSVSKVADKPSFPANHPDGCMCDTCKGVRAAVTKSVETPPVDNVVKSAEYVSLEKRYQELEERIQKRDEADKEMSIRKKFDGLTLAIDLDAQMPVLKGLSGEEVDKYVATLKAADEQVLKGNLFREIGTGGVGETSVEKQLEAKAVEIQKSENGLTYEQAYTKAMERNPKLYEEYMGGAK